jgi:hypothetical protein
VNNKAQTNREQINEAQVNNKMSHERNKAQVAYLFAMERAPVQESAPLVAHGGLTQKLLAGGALLHRRAHPTSVERAPAQGSAPLPRRARSFRLQKSSFKVCSQGARSFLGERAPSHEGVPFLARGLRYKLCIFVHLTTLHINCHFNNLHK